MTEDGQMQRFKELWNLGTTVVAGSTVVIGCLCIFWESSITGTFPEDMTFAQGLALAFLFIGFTMTCGLYWIGVTSVGLVLVRWPMEAMKLVRKLPPHAVAYVSPDFQPMWAFPVWVVASIAVIVATLSFKIDGKWLLIYGCIVVVQGVLGAILLVFNRRLQFDDTGISLSNHRVEHPEHNPKSFRKFRYAIVVLWVLFPFIMSKEVDGFVGAAFRLAQLRKDHATVHLASPWDLRLVEVGLQRRDSFLGADYARFDDVIVRMKSIGSRVVLEVPSQPKGTTFVSVPRQFIEIE